MWPKDAGFRFSGDLKVWYTPDLKVAAKLERFSDALAKEKLSEIKIVKGSWLWPLLSSPDDGLEVLPHQLEATLWALERNRSYLALKPGLGKSIVAARIFSEFQEMHHMRGVYILPPMLVENALYELTKWAPELRVSVYGKKEVDFTYTDILLLPDSRLTDPSLCTALSYYIGKKVPILIVDEAHRFSNEESKRTKALFGFIRKVSKENVPGLCSLFVKRVMMSGTPMTNRPMNLFSVLSSEAPEALAHMSRFEFGLRYCAGHQVQITKDKKVWNFTGASNVSELSVKMHENYMLSMGKDLLNLPEKIEELFIISDDMSPALARVDGSVKDTCGTDPYELIKNLGHSRHDTHVTTYLRMCGKEKVPSIVKYIDSIMEETDEAILVYAYFEDTVNLLEESLSHHSPSVITGKVPVGQRQKMVNDFQNSTHRRIMIGNYKAMGVGFTLTKASRVIFVEFDWVPGNNEQAEDRAHRIGQTKTVYVQYAVFKNSLDLRVLETVLRKRGHIALVK